MAEGPEICKLSATALAREIREGRIRATEALDACLESINRLDDRLQSFITVDAEGARATAETCDALPAKGPLHGVPIAIKDVTATAGLRTTSGSRLLVGNVPEADELSVVRLRQAGAVIVGKTNTPEFAFGAICANRLRGPTANPWNTELTSGGSSGGSAVAVTAGLVPLAQGTDFGGSVRTPASFCGCVGMRPTPGTIPEPGRALAFDTLATQGVLARNVDDAFLMVHAMAGEDRRDPTSARPAWPKEATQRWRVAASTDLDGAYRVDAEVATAFDQSVSMAQRVIGPVRRAAPDCTGASDAFKTLRAAASWFKFGDMVERHEDELTPSFVWNVRQGRALTASDLLAAETVRSRVWREFRRFFERFDVLMLPAASVLPFPNAQKEVWEVGGEECETIIDYLACTYIISLVGFPALTIPALWTADRRPFGVQLVARPHNEAALLGIGRELEAAGFSHRWPDLTEARAA